jgi:hypothetical protein
MLPKRITDIYKALANLYGAILTDDAYPIMKTYFPNLVKKDLYNDLKERKYKDTRGYTIWTTENHNYLITAEYISEEEISRILSQRNEKKYFLYSNFEDFIRYKDDSYCEGNESCKTFHDFLLNSLNMNEKEIHKEMRYFLYAIRIQMKEPQKILSHLADKTQNENQFEKLCSLFFNFYNNLKIPYNLGYAPYEMQMSEEKKKILDELKKQGYYL